MGKYKGLELIKSLGFNIPETIYICNSDLNNEFFDILLISKKIDYPCIFRSSSINEFENINSGLLDSYILNNKEDIINCFYKIKIQNFELIQNGSYSLILQPLLRGDISGVLYYKDNKLYVEYSKSGYNFGVTGKQNEQLSFFYYDYESNSYYKNEDIDKILILIKSIKQIKDNRLSFMMEFTIQKYDLIALQYIPNIKSKYFNILPYMNYINVFKGISDLMNNLGYEKNEYFIVENDHFLFFHKLGFYQFSNESLEHIFINLNINKFKEYEYARKGSDMDYYPTDTNSKRLVEQFIIKYKVDILFTNMYTKSILKKDYKLYIYKGDSFGLPFLYNSDINNIFVKKELLFFINRLRQFNYKNYNNIYLTYINKLKNLKKLYKVDQNIEIKKSISFIYKTIFLIEKYKNINTTNGDVVSGTIVSTKSGYEDYIMYNGDIHLIESFSKNIKGKIAFYCDDFEPSWLKYLNFIDIVITLRGNLLAHGVQICERNNTDIIYDFYSTKFIRTLDVCKVDFDKGKLLITKKYEK